MQPPKAGVLMDDRSVNVHYFSVRLLLQPSLHDGGDEDASHIVESVAKKRRVSRKKRIVGVSARSGGLMEIAVKWNGHLAASQVIRHSWAA